MVDFILSLTSTSGKVLTWILLVFEYPCIHFRLMVQVSTVWTDDGLWTLVSLWRCPHLS
jgi:hypothetical protein